MTISNHLPGIVNIEIGADRPKGLVVGSDKTELARDEKAVVSFSVVGRCEAIGTVRIGVRGPFRSS